MKEFQINTFSIIGYDPKTKGLGIAVASKWLAVGAIVPYVKAGVWAIATQANTNISFWPKWLELLQSGYTSQEVLDKLLLNDFNPESRQLAIMDISWNWATYTGEKCTQWAWWIVSKNCVVQWNMLTWESTIIAMKEAFENSNWSLAQRLYNALLVWDSKWGDKRGKQSASLLVVNSSNIENEVNGNIIDLRVDDSINPIEELWKLLEKHIDLYK